MAKQLGRTLYNSPRLEFMQEVNRYIAHVVLKRHSIITVSHMEKVADVGSFCL